MPQPRQRLQEYPSEIKVEDVNDLTGKEFFAEEAARYDDIDNYKTEDEKDCMKNDVIGFNKLLQYSRQLLRLLLSIGRPCDDWRRRPIQ
eukprot:5459605-Amphidinium_carterae.1